MVRALMPPLLMTMSLSLAGAALLAGGGVVAQPAWAQSHPAAKAAAAPSSVQQGHGFSALVASRSAAVVEIHTLRGWRGTSDTDAETGAEFMPDGEFADRLAWPLPTGTPYAQAPQVRDLAVRFILAPDGLIMNSAPGPAHVGRASLIVIGRACGDGAPSANSDTSTTPKPPVSSA